MIEVRRLIPGLLASAVLTTAPALAQTADTTTVAPPPVVRTSFGVEQTTKPVAQNDALAAKVAA